MRPVSFHGVHMNAGILLVECKGCERRVALTKQELPAIHGGNQDFPHDRKWKCERCGSREVRLYVPINQNEAKMWLAGDWLHEARRTM